MYGILCNNNKKIVHIILNYDMPQYDVNFA